MNDWRRTSKGKPSKKWISYLRKAAKIRRDMQLKKDIYSNPLLKRQHKELTNLKYRATLQDIKDYSKGMYYPLNKYPTILALHEFLILNVIKTNPTLKKLMSDLAMGKRYSTKPKKKKTVKKSMTKGKKEIDKLLKRVGK